QRVIFGTPIGANQGVQFPIAKAHTAVEAAALMRDKAAALFDAGQPCGPEANMAKYLAAEAAWEAANACIDCHGGYGFAEEYDGERQFRECRLYKTAPVNNNLVLAYVGEHVLGMPRSYYDLGGGRRGPLRLSSGRRRTMETTMELPEHVTICEVGTRDGFQIEPDFVSTEAKIEVVNLLSDAGVPRIEVTSFVH